MVCILQCCKLQKSFQPFFYYQKSNSSSKSNCYSLFPGLLGRVDVSFGLYTGIEVVPGQIHMLSFHLFCVCAGAVVRLEVMWSDWGCSLAESANFYFR